VTPRTPRYGHCRRWMARTAAEMVAFRQRGDRIAFEHARARLAVWRSLAASALDDQPRIFGWEVA
jgi:hypothetical protein